MPMPGCAEPSQTLSSPNQPCQSVYRHWKAPHAMQSAVDSPCVAMPCPADPSLTRPLRAQPFHAGPCLTRPNLMVSPPHSRLSLSGYRLFTALALICRAQPRRALPIFYRSALDAMPVRALIFAIASMFARRCSSVSSKCRRLRSLLPAVRNTLRALDSNSFTATPVCS